MNLPSLGIFPLSSSKQTLPELKIARLLTRMLHFSLIQSQQVSSSILTLIDHLNQPLSPEQYRNYPIEQIYEQNKETHTNTLTGSISLNSHNHFLLTLIISPSDKQNNQEKSYLITAHFFENQYQQIISDILLKLSITPKNPVMLPISWELFHKLAQQQHHDPLFFPGAELITLIQFLKDRLIQYQNPFLLYYLLEKLGDAKNIFVTTKVFNELENTLDPEKISPSIINFYLQTKQIKQAKVSLEKLPETMQHSPLILRFQSEISLLKKNYASAFKYALEALREDPLNPDLILMIFKSLQHTKSQSLFTHFIKRIPDPLIEYLTTSIEFQNILGTHFFSQGEYSKTLHYLHGHPQNPLYLKALFFAEKFQDLYDILLTQTKHSVLNPILFNTLQYHFENKDKRQLSQENSILFDQKYLTSLAKKILSYSDIKKLPLKHHLIMGLIAITLEEFHLAEHYLKKQSDKKFDKQYTSIKTLLNGLLSILVFKENRKGGMLLLRSYYLSRGSSESLKAMIHFHHSQKNYRRYRLFLKLWGDHTDPFYQYQRIRYSLDQKKYQKSINLLNQYKKTIPIQYYIYLKGELYYHTKKYQQMIDLLQVNQKIFEDHPWLNFYLGTVLIEQFDRSEGIPYLKRCCELQHDNHVFSQKLLSGYKHFQSKISPQA